MNVDMATYKAEFLSHYYEGRLRPRYAYAHGAHLLVGASCFSGPVTCQLVTQAPVLGNALPVAGRHFVSPVRCPAFAPETFKAWWLRRARAATWVARE